jgi:non-canonical (house-cleaning) NTP pyrophosphatase
MTSKKLFKKTVVCAENRVRAVVGQPPAQHWLGLKSGISADYLVFFINAQNQNKCSSNQHLVKIILHFSL